MSPQLFLYVIQRKTKNKDNKRASKYIWQIRRDNLKIKAATETLGTISILLASAPFKQVATLSL